MYVTKPFFMTTSHLQSARFWWRSIHVSSSGPAFRELQLLERTLLIVISFLQVPVSVWIAGLIAEVIISSNMTGTAHNAGAISRCSPAA
jgi:hypothetical protein